MNSIPVYAPFAFGALTVMSALLWTTTTRPERSEESSVSTAITELLAAIAMVISFVGSLITSMLLVAGG
jgi:hypothetical protein